MKRLAVDWENIFVKVYLTKDVLEASVLKDRPKPNNKSTSSLTLKWASSHTGCVIPVCDGVEQAKL